MEKEKSHNSKGLIILLCVLVVVIVGLVVGICVINLNNQGENNVVVEEAEVSGSLRALKIDNSIVNKIDNDENYTVDDAIAEYEKETSFGSAEKRVYLLFDYANFVYDEYGDIDVAIEILKRAEPLLDGLSMTSDYYIATAGLYRKSGNEEQAEVYEQKIKEITPSIIQDGDERGEMKEGAEKEIVE